MIVEQVLDARFGDDMRHELLALVVRDGRQEAPGLQWVTDADSTLQLGFHLHPAGRSLAPHVHLPEVRRVPIPQEFLLVKRGLMRVDFYDSQRNYCSSKHLRTGDMVLLVSGGHGFEFLEETELLEIKQGPYVGAALDKSKFERPEGAGENVT